MRRNLLSLGLLLACCTRPPEPDCSAGPPTEHNSKQVFGSYAPEYRRVGQTIFFEDVCMEGATSIELVLPQRESAEYLRRYARDSRRVFYRGRPIEGADPATFEVVDPYTGYARDDSYVFFEDQVIPGASPWGFGCSVTSRFIPTREMRLRCFISASPSVRPRTQASPD
jgi:hypothetical protein